MVRAILLHAYLAQFSPLQGREWPTGRFLPRAGETEQKLGA